MVTLVIIIIFILVLLFIVVVILILIILIVIILSGGWFTAIIALRRVGRERVYLGDVLGSQEVEILMVIRKEKQLREIEESFGARRER